MATIDKRVIEAVREFPCFWDMACKGYKDTIGKGNAWKEVSKKVTALSQLSVHCSHTWSSSEPFVLSV